MTDNKNLQSRVEKMSELKPGDAVMWQRAGMLDEKPGVVARATKHMVHLVSGERLTGLDYIARLSEPPAPAVAEAAPVKTTPIQRTPRAPRRRKAPATKRNTGLLPPELLPAAPGCRMPVTDGARVMQCGLEVPAYGGMYCEIHSEVSGREATRAQQAVRAALRRGRDLLGVLRDRVVCHTADYRATPDDTVTVPPQFPPPPQVDACSTPPRRFRLLLTNRTVDAYGVFQGEYSSVASARGAIADASQAMCRDRAPGQYDLEPVAIVEIADEVTPRVVVTRSSTCDLVPGGAEMNEARYEFCRQDLPEGGAE